MSTNKKGAQAPQTKGTAPAGTSAEALRVVPKQPGFRRAGIAFPEDGLTIPLSQLTAEQLEQLENEPALVTHRVDIAQPAADGAEPADENPAA